MSNSRPVRDCELLPDVAGFKCRNCGTLYAKRIHVNCAGPFRNASLECMHRGEETGRVGCGSCKGRVQIKTFA